MPSSPWLQAIVANVQDAIVLLDSDGRVIFESPAASELLGLLPDGAAGAFGLQRIHPEERDAVIRSFERTIATPGSLARATYRFRDSEGRWRHLEALAKNLLDDPALHGVLITFREVTDRIEALEAAERAGRDREEFVSRLSHELRTPLHAILGWAQLLECGGAGDPLEAAEQIIAAGQHLLGIVDELLEVAPVQEGRVELEIAPLSLEETIAPMVELIRPLALREGIRLEIGPASARTSVLADRERLRQVVLNLLSNAVRYNRPGGIVRIDWECVVPQRVRLSITDTGPGIPRAALHRVFEPFERLGADAKGSGGTGLGLFITRRLVERMGGTMGLESRPGVGTTFWLELAGDGPPPAIP